MQHCTPCLSQAIKCRSVIDRATSDTCTPWNGNRKGKLENFGVVSLDNYAARESGKFSLYSISYFKMVCNHVGFKVLEIFLFAFFFFFFKASYA